MGSQELAMSDTVNKKLCIIGDGATGKTSFLFRFKNNEFDESKEYEPTIFENENKIFDMNGKEINLSLWDTAGQEDFKTVRQLAYDNIDILVIAFSIVVRQSFQNVKDFWHKEVQDNLVKFKDTKIVLIGTKSDLKNDSDSTGQPKDAPISKAEGETLANEINAVCYVETSAKTGEGIEEAVHKGVEASMTNKPRSSLPFNC